MNHLQRQIVVADVHGFPVFEGPLLEFSQDYAVEPDTLYAELHNAQESAGHTPEPVELDAGGVMYSVSLTDADNAFDPAELPA